MEKKKVIFDRTTLITSAVCLLPLVLAAAVYNELPEQIAVHWNAAGNPDRYMPKIPGALMLPVMFLVINLVVEIFLNNDPKQAHISQSIKRITRWIAPVFSLILVPVILFIALGREIPIVSIVMVLAGVMIMLFGNYLPKNRQNYTVGIRLPWTLCNEENWNKTHRIAGRLWVLGGMGIIIAGFIYNEHVLVTILISIVVVITLIPAIYSFQLYKKENAGMV